jgi:uncharacterized protein (DUF983 family)
MSISAVIKLALRLRCPACGKGKIYNGFLRVADNCSHCNLALKEHDAADGPAYVVMSLMSIKVVVLALILEFTVEPPAWLHVIIWIPFTILGSLIMLRFTKSLFIAIQYHHKIGNLK